MSARDHGNLLCRLCLFLAVILALLALPVEAAEDDLGVPQSLGQSEDSGVVMGDTVPFTTNPIITNPVAPNLVPHSPSPEELSPLPFAGDPKVVSPEAAMFSPVPIGPSPSSGPSSGPNPNRIPVFRDLVPVSPQPAQTPDRLGIEPARQYMLFLINRDRQSYGLGRVSLDDIATKAGQLHTNEMVQYRYHGHWGLDGKKPDQRYTEAGGMHHVAENAWFTSGDDDHVRHTISVEEQPLFDKRQIEEIESSFVNEAPPNDGHKRNILNPLHTNVGIALSKVSQGLDWPRVACTQEFIDRYGEYTPIPAAVSPGARFTVSGKLYPGIQLHNIDLKSEPLAKPLSVGELNKTGGYTNPTENVASYWPIPQPDHETIVLKNDGSGEEFSVQVTVDSGGLYYVWIWAQLPGGSKPFLVSSRTVTVR